MQQVTVFKNLLSPLILGINGVINNKIVVSGGWVETNAGLMDCYVQSKNKMPLSSIVK